MQKEIDFIIKNEIEKFRLNGAENCAVIIAEKKNGGIKCYIGSTDYEDKLFSGAINYAKIKHSPGSALKPLIYAIGMQEHKFNASSILEDVGLILTLRTGLYSPRNYKRNFLGPVTYRTALGNSRNIPAVRVAHAIGLPKIAEYCVKSGLTDNYEFTMNSGLSVVLGGMEISIERLAMIYGMLANDGKKYLLDFFPDCNINSERKNISIIKPNIARQISLFLADPLARLPGFNRLGNLEYDFPVAVKTGTSTGYRDAVVAAYTNKYIICIWLGTRNHTKMDRLTGENSAAAILSKIIPVLHPSNKIIQGDMDFAPPENHKQLSICSLSGMLTGNDCQHTSLEWFDVSNIPTKKCCIHKKIIIDIRNGKKAENDCPQEYRITKNYTELSHKYADWAKESGFEILPPDFYNTINFFSDNNQNDKNVFQRKITINEPAHQTKIFMDPDAPPEMQTIALKTTIEPVMQKVLWIIDNKPYKIQEYPFTTRWHIQRGKHSVSVKLLDTGQESAKHIFDVE